MTTPAANAEEAEGQLLFSRDNSGIRATFESIYLRRAPNTITIFIATMSYIPGKPNLKRDIAENHKTDTNIMVFFAPNYVSGSANAPISDQFVRQFLEHHDIRKYFNVYYQIIQRPSTIGTWEKWMAYLTLVLIIETRFHKLTNSPGPRFMFAFNMDNRSRYVSSVMKTWHEYARHTFSSLQTIGGHVFCDKINESCTRNNCEYFGEPWHFDLSRFEQLVIPSFPIQLDCDIDRFLFHFDNRYNSWLNCVLSPMLNLQQNIPINNIINELDESITPVQSKTVYIVSVVTGKTSSVYVGVTASHIVPRHSHWNVPLIGKPKSLLARSLRPNSRVFLVYEKSYPALEAEVIESILLEIVKFRRHNTNFEFLQSKVINKRSEYIPALRMTKKQHEDTAIFLESSIPVLAPPQYIIDGNNENANQDDDVNDDANYDDDDSLDAEDNDNNDGENNDNLNQPSDQTLTFPGNLKFIRELIIPQKFKDYLRRTYPEPEIIVID